MIVHAPPGPSSDRSGAGSVACDVALLRRLVVAAAIAWSTAFIVLWRTFDLHLFADGSIFSYAVAVQDAWAFHWSNISARVVGYLLTFVPAEALIERTGDVPAGIRLYGTLHAAAPLTSLALTYVLDRTVGRVVFVWAGASTALLCPLVLAYPSEMWMTHAAFWPTLAIVLDEAVGPMVLVKRTLGLATLILSHEGGVPLAVAMLATLVLRRPPGPNLRASAFAFAVAMSAWTAMRLAFPPHPYIAEVLVGNAFDFVDPANLATPVMQLLGAALAAFAALFVTLRTRWPQAAATTAALVVVVSLGVYWLAFDATLHATDRYAARTAILLVPPVLGVLAAGQVIAASGASLIPLPDPRDVRAWLARAGVLRAAAAAFVLIGLVHVVETAKFVTAWRDYLEAVESLATGAATDPGLGDPAFVSARRISPDLDRLAWNSTTPFLSALVAPDFRPSRLVVDPRTGYFWLPCEVATANAEGDRHVPGETRRLIARYSCLHR